MERGRFPLVGKFRPSGGDFQGIWVYRSDVFWGGARKVISRALQHRLDEPTGLSLGMVASLQWGTRLVVWTIRKGTIVYAEDASGVGS
jgi:hypothetical protein